MIPDVSSYLRAAWVSRKENSNNLNKERQEKEGANWKPSLEKNQTSPNAQ